MNATFSDLGLQVCALGCGYFLFAQPTHSPATTGSLLEPPRFFPKRSCYVGLFTDSVYVGKGLTDWMKKWKSNGWKRREGKSLKPVKNEDLWRQLDELISKHRIKYTRVAKHSGHPENERCDDLAVEAAQKFR